MPSAGRAFTWQLLLALKRQGVQVASLVLHTGLSSYMDDRLDALHLASEEEYSIPDSTARLVDQTRAKGGRVIAVGTTVVRALESAWRGGVIASGRDYTRLRITAKHRLRCVDGLLTGMHEPEASHLDLLSAFLPPRLIESSYASAVERGYLWHEFGDLNLIL
jgi:S-adenosylmethionine:tRNA ribosyltransferase-isomerase